ncbi:MAG: TldD/PmbA family protein [bacterium]|nr:TldD/PmbA family protein [bacterium]
MKDTMTNISQYVLDLAKNRTSSAEVYHIRSEDTQVEFKSDELKVMYTRYTNGIGLRVIVDGKIGYSSTTDIDNLPSLVNKAFNSAKYGQEAKFQFPTGKQLHKSKPASDIYDIAVAQCNVDAMVESGKRLVAFVKENAREAKCDVEIIKRLANIEIINSTGLHVHYQKTLYTEFINAVEVEPDGFLWIDEYYSSGKLVHLPEKLLIRLVDKMKTAKNKVSVTTQLMPVIFAPKALYSILYGFEMGCNGKYIQKGTSPMTGKLGQQIFNSALTIIDDPTIPFGVNSTPYDDEGIVHRPITLVDTGKLTHYIYDLQTAGLMHTHSTGHGHRSFSNLPSPEYTNLVINPGEIPYATLISGIQEGIIVHQILGGGQSNLLAGDFSVNVDLGFKIEKGQIVGRVKDTMVSGNIYDAFRHIAAMSQEQETVGNIIAPAILFEKLNVTSSAGS